MKILIFGLSGSGKTTMANDLSKYLEQCGFAVKRINGDDVRKVHNDWDFSQFGRERQAVRMRNLANEWNKHVDFVICDFICPLESFRKTFGADYSIWMNTSKICKYGGKNPFFEKPKNVDFEVKEKGQHKVVEQICKDLM